MSEANTSGDQTTEAPETHDSLTGGAGDDTLTGGDDTINVNEGLADHPDDVTEEVEQTARGPSEEQLHDIGRTVRAAEAALAKAEGPQHGTHDAAMKGLQTDASGSYTPPEHPRF